MGAHTNNGTHIMLDNEQIHVQNLLYGEAKYKKLVSEHPDKKVSLVCHGMVYYSNFGAGDELT